MAVLTFKVSGVCSREMVIEHADGVIQKCTIIGGCPGNTQGVSRLVEGMKVEDVIKRLEGIRCGIRPTSCPDQLAKGLKQLLQ